MHEPQDVEPQTKEHSKLIDLGVEEVEKQAGQADDDKAHGLADRKATHVEKELGSNTAE
jgi:hypothetical protein